MSLYTAEKYFSYHVLRWGLVWVGAMIMSLASASVCKYQPSMEKEDSLTLKAGAAKREITPNVQVKNWVTGKPYTGVSDPIYARALMLSDGSSTFVFIHWEIVDAGESATYTIRKKIAEQFSIPEQNVLVNAAHNHSAPWAPVYGETNFRGKDRDPWWVHRYMESQYEDTYFLEWMDLLMNQTVAAVAEAQENLQKASVHVGLYDVSNFVQNRRPRPVTWGVKSSDLPKGYNYKHPDWDPNVLSGNRTFGSLNRAMTVLSFRNEAGENISTVFQFACHAVSIYPYSDDLSGDWSSQVCEALNQTLGGENLFLQGTAGDVNPWKRGREAVEEMTHGLSSAVAKAYEYSAELYPDSLYIGQKKVGLPLTTYGQELTGLSILETEVQAVAMGPLALVTLPGEPMTDLSLSIQSGSPFPHTLVLGYSNGNGGHYCGMPGEKSYGGYEVGPKTNLGTDNAGLFLVKSALELLHELAAQQNRGE